MSEKKIQPAFQTQPYTAKETVRCRDRYQQFCWLREGVYPLDIYESKGDVIMIFPRNEKTKELYIKWRNREL